jgi:hypothetical protein
VTIGVVDDRIRKAGGSGKWGTGERQREWPRYDMLPYSSNDKGGIEREDSNHSAARARNGGSQLDTNQEKTKIKKNENKISN